MPSATDIITYIGVPLAVAGVLPILSVVLKTFIFSLHVRSKLKQNLNAVGLYKTPFWLPVWSSRLRAPRKWRDNPVLQDGKYFEKILYHSVDVDVLTGQVNLSFPIVRLHILPRNHGLYKNMRGDVEKRSRLPGGSWTILYFVPELAHESVSHAEDESRTYVLRPTDKICQRPARVHFASLVRYLLDLGAVAQPTGWADLRENGLGVANRTVLLTSKCEQSVLVVRKQEAEEDDRLLAVLLDWVGVLKLFEKGSAHLAASISIPIRHGLQPKIADTRLYHTELTASQQSAIELLLSEHGIERASWSSPKTDKVTPPGIGHLTSGNHGDPSPGMWFSAVAFALRSNTQTFIDYVIPTHIFDFAHESYSRNASIPCGVLHYCGLIDVRDCATWTPKGQAVTGFGPDNEERPACSTAPFSLLGEGAAPTTTPGTSADTATVVERDQIPHLLASPKWTVEAIGKHMIIWIYNNFIVECSTRTTEMAELILHRMVNFPAEALDLGEMLNRWLHWYKNGLGVEDVQYMKDHKTTFALAACLLYALGKHTHTKDARTPGLLEECLRRSDDVLIY